MCDFDPFQYMVFETVEQDDVLNSTPLVILDELISPILVPKKSSLEIAHDSMYTPEMLTTKLHDKNTCKKIPMTSRLLSGGEKLLQYRFYEKHKPSSAHKYQKKQARQMKKTLHCSYQPQPHRRIQVFDKVNTIKKNS